MDDEGDEEIVPFASSKWSWCSTFAEFFLMISVGVEAVSTFVKSLSIQFMRLHNKFIDDTDRQDDGEKFARDVMSGLDTLD